MLKIGWNVEKMILKKIYPKFGQHIIDQKFGQKMKKIKVARNWMKWQEGWGGGGTVGEHTTYIKSKGIFHVMNIFLALILTELEHF